MRKITTSTSNWIDIQASSEILTRAVKSSSNSLKKSDNDFSKRTESQKFENLLLYKKYKTSKTRDDEIKIIYHKYLELLLSGFVIKTKLLLLLRKNYRK